MSKMPERNVFDLNSTIMDVKVYPEQVAKGFIR